MENIVKVQIDSTWENILVYNKDMSLTKQFTDPKIAHKLWWPLSKRYMYYEIINKEIILWDFVEDKSLWF
jgi:hypothetical protein